MLDAIQSFFRRLADLLHVSHNDFIRSKLTQRPDSAS